MLQMHCPECREVIKSPYLAELSSIACDHCKEDVAVKDVFVATEGFTMHRDDLLNRISRFQKLLGEVEKEMQVIEGSETVSKTTRSSINKFHTTLQELLIGARSNYRLEIPDGLPIEMDYNNDKRTARLVNLSTVGASLELDMSGELPRHKAEIKLQFALPDAAESLSMLAKIVWIRKVTKDADSQLFQIGVKFMNSDEKIRDTLWNYIVASSPVARP
jgi:hypothetical protein